MGCELVVQTQEQRTYEESNRAVAACLDGVRGSLYRDPGGTLGELRWQRQEPPEKVALSALEIFGVQAPDRSLRAA